MYHFTYLPNEYVHGSRKFKNSLEFSLSVLHLDGVTITAYLDDCINMNRSFQECWKNTKQIAQTFQNLSFTVHPEPKSVFPPSQKIEFLDFSLNLVTMAITLTNEKKRQLKSFCTNILLVTTTNVRTIASSLGKIPAVFCKIWQTSLCLGRCKTAALSKHRGNYNSKI